MIHRNDDPREVLTLRSHDFSESDEHGDVKPTPLHASMKPMAAFNVL